MQQDLRVSRAILVSLFLSVLSTVVLPGSGKAQASFTALGSPRVETSFSGFRANDLSDDGQLVVGLNGYFPGTWTRGSGLVSPDLGLSEDGAGGIERVSGDGGTYLLLGNDFGPFAAYYDVATTTLEYRFGMVAVYDISTDGQRSVGIYDSGHWWDGSVEDRVTGLVQIGLDALVPIGETLLAFSPLSISGDGTQVVGTLLTEQDSNGDLSTYSFHWTEGMGAALFDGATGISSNGTWITGAASGGGLLRWSAATGFETIPTPAAWSGGDQISDNGKVILSGTNVWIEDLGTMTLQEFLETENGIDLTGWTLTTARMSADGTHFVGMGENPSAQNEGWLVNNAVPEPGFAMSLALAATMMAQAARRRPKR